MYLLGTILAIVIYTTSASSRSELLKIFTKSNHQFVSDTYKEIATHQSSNFLVCPFSLESVLSLAHNGAKDETAREIRDVLHLPKDKINKIFKELSKNFKKKNDSYTFLSANKIYISETTEIKQKFQKDAKKIFGTTVENVNFGESQKAAKKINDWVAEKTNNHIKNLVSGDSLKEDTVALLVNALYFEGQWEKHFKKTLTKERDFYITSEEKVQIDCMQRTHIYDYFEDSELGAKFLKIPFKDDSISMVIVLPNARDGLEEIEVQSEKLFTKVNFTRKLIDLTLPKFKIETSLDLKEILIKLGIKKAFTRADFSGMAGAKGEIHISDVIQKTFIAIDEHGVEAAASSAVYFHPKSLMEFACEKTMFVVDHPFIFYIQVGDTIIFTGRVKNPKQ